MALAGVSSRSVHPCRGTSTELKRVTPKSPAALIDFVISSVLIGTEPSERETQTPRDGAGPRITEIIDAARRETGVRMYFRIQPGIARQQEQVVARHVDPSAPGRSRQGGQVEGVFYGEILQPYERSAFDPPGRENGRLANTGLVVQRRDQEVLVLERIAFRGVDERGVVEH